MHCTLYFVCGYCTRLLGRRAGFKGLEDPSKPPRHGLGRRHTLNHQQWELTPLVEEQNSEDEDEDDSKEEEGEGGESNDAGEREGDGVVAALFCCYDTAARPIDSQWLFEVVV